MSSARLHSIRAQFEFDFDFVEKKLSASREKLPIRLDCPQPCPHIYTPHRQHESPCCPCHGPRFFTTSATTGRTFCDELKPAQYLFPDLSSKKYSKYLFKSHDASRQHPSSFPPSLYIRADLPQHRKGNNPPVSSPCDLKSSPVDHQAHHYRRPTSPLPQKAMGSFTDCTWYGSIARPIEGGTSRPLELSSRCPKPLDERLLQHE